jgi:hypothetical protein
VAIIPGNVFRTLFDTEAIIRNMTVQASSTPVLNAALAEVRRVLKRGGCVAIDAGFIDVEVFEEAQKGWICAVGRLEN